MRILQNVNIDFLTKRKIFYFISVALIVIGFAVLLTNGLTLGIDFKGGNEILLRFQQDVAIQNVRETMSKIGITGAEIKTMGNEREILIRTSEEGEGTVVTDKIKEALKNDNPNNSYEVLRIDKVGPKIGKELRTAAIYATAFSFLAILIYLAFRFEFVYALGSVIALIHDILMTLGMIAIFNLLFPALNLELSQGMVAAFLTLIGFSINDTVVVFDRIRENIKLYKNEDILKVMNRSVNATLSRTVITGGALFFAVLVLFLFGGEVNKSFAFTFLIGMITGTYSSIFVASAFVVDIKKIQQRRRDAAKQHARPAAFTKV
ncbi:MAG: protein translocase subunit SecF [Ignavibacteriae bacterium]|nr:MAG: protein translocase subunit SecF [Ignavibacteriota bacterium]